MDFRSQKLILSGLVPKYPLLKGRTPVSFSVLVRFNWGFGKVGVAAESLHRAARMKDGSEKC